MNQSYIYSLKTKQKGFIVPEIYSTAWVALVPDKNNLKRPAWPEALNFIRTNQLSDGGWGASGIYYAHDRLISTLAAIYALSVWNNPTDAQRITHGVEALHQYALDFPTEPYDPIGFELLLPSLLTKLERFDLDLPTYIRSYVYKESTAKKLMLIGSLEVDYASQRTWWFNMEMLPEDALARIDERILDEYGSIATSTATTAAYLRALRVHGKDSRRAEAYLQQVLQECGGGAGVTYPIDLFELMWSLDNFRRAGLNPTHPNIRLLIQRLSHFWHQPPLGISWNQAFRVKDGDHPAVAYKVLCWAGLNPSDEPILPFWDERAGYYHTYLDEREPSFSANVHGLTAFRHDPTNKMHRRFAIGITEWLRQEINGPRPFLDKWHISPFYGAGRLIPTLIDWDHELLQQCIEFILNNQHESGGWGVSQPTLEETSYAVLGLTAARRAGLLLDTAPLRHASTFLNQHYKSQQYGEQLWIGKSLYYPIGVVQATIYAARMALSQQTMRYLSSKYWSTNKPIFDDLPAISVPA